MWLRIASSLVTAAVATLLLSGPAESGQSSAEFLGQVHAALRSVCAYVDLGRTVSAAYGEIAQSLKGIPVHRIGKAGEDRIRQALDDAGLPYSEQTRFSDAESKRGRRGDFQVSDGRSIVNIESKNKARIGLRDAIQISDYGTGRTVLAFREGAKFSRSAKAVLGKLIDSGTLELWQCAFEVF
jgi:hypothetical protein